MSILFSHYVLDGIHGSEVGVVFAGPAIPIHVQILHQLLCLLVGSSDESAVLFEPVPEELLIGLGNQQVVLVCRDHQFFGVGFFVIGPIEGSSEVRMEVHHYSGCLTISIEDHLTRQLCDI